MIFLKSESEIEKMRTAAQLVSRTLAEVAKQIKPGVETGKLDRIAEDLLQNTMHARHLRAMEGARILSLLRCVSP
jgi:methionine aminopeptidase